MGKTQTPCARAQRNNLIFCFALAMVLVGGIYLLLGFWPFGDGTMLTGDLNGQYVASPGRSQTPGSGRRLFLQLRQAVRRQHAGAVRLLHGQAPSI